MDNNNIELLVKYKELLDNGIISQEEFEAKKAEILSIPETEPAKAVTSNSTTAPTNTTTTTTAPANTNPDDDGSAGWAVLGAFIPLVGLILFLVWNTSKPNCAKKAGIGALIGVGIVILCYMLIGCTAASYYY